MKKQGQLLRNLGWGIVGDILLIIAAIVIMGLFAISSISSAYLIALVALLSGIVIFAWYRKSRKKADS